MKHLLFMLFCALTSAVVLAQEGGGSANLDVNITKSDSGGGIPWLWVIGGIVFIVLLVALLGGGGGRDRIVEKRTVIKD